MKKIITISVLMIFMVSIFATNGMNMIGYGPRSSAMGGFSLGLLDDGNSTNTNPGAISFIKNKQLDVSLGLLLPTVNFKNNINDLEGENEIFPLPDFTYVNGNDGKFTWGLAFYSQGGMGATFKNIKHNVLEIMIMIL